MTDKYVAALDVGTTTIRCYIYDKSVRIRGTACEQVNFVYAVLLDEPNIY